MSDVAYAEPAATPPPSDEQDTKPYLDVAELKEQHENYYNSKTDEINEKCNARAYYAGSQWTSEELKKLKARNQPPITRNRIKRKINGVVGLVERMRQDPKAYPRTPNDDGSADIATAVIRYVLDNNRWESLSSKIAGDVAKEGLGGLELGLVQTKQGDYDVTLNRVPTDSYFYDPTSSEADFSDVLYHGVAKWVDMEIAKTFCPPDRWDEIASTNDSEGTTDDEKRTVRWYDSKRKKVRLVDHWYYRNGTWCWALHTKTTILMEGQTPYYDPDGKPISKFIMFSANVDQDLDRYGFFRDMKDIQDETNHRYSKALHLLNTRRIIARKGSFSDINKVRSEANKTDGIIEWETEKPEFDDAKSLADMQGQLRFLEDAKAEIENFGPNPALMGMAEGAKSGRAIALLQQAGIAELGTYIIEYKDWKLRVYRSVFCAAKKHWTLERWIRVTDPEDEMQMLQINGLRTDEYGMPQTVNSMASIDVDIIIDEGSDTVNAMQDAFDALGVLASRGAEVPPGLLIELAPINSRIKKKWLKQMEEAQASDPMKEEAKKIALESEDAKVMETKSKAIKNMADAMKNVAEGAYSPATLPYEPHLLGLADLLDSDEGNDAGVPVPPVGTRGPAGGIPLQPGAMPDPAEQLAGGQFPAAPANQPP